MKFPKLHIIWTEGKNLALPDTHYPVLANKHNNYFEINVDKNEYHPSHTRSIIQKQKQI